MGQRSECGPAGRSCASRVKHIREHLRSVCALLLLYVLAARPHDHRQHGCARHKAGVVAYVVSRSRSVLLLAPGKLCIGGWAKLL